MYNNGIPEKLIAETSGHKSAKRALRQYEHTSEEQKKGVTSVINQAEREKLVLAEEKPTIQPTTGEPNE